MVGVATIYTMVSGFYGVVFTDMVQSLIILIAVAGVSSMAIAKIGRHPGEFAELARNVSGNKDWMTTMPGWVTTMPDNKNYLPYQHLLLFASFYFLKNVVAGLGMGGDPKYFGARNDRECGTLTFLWTWLMAVRWPMIMAFAVLGIFLVRDLFPDQGVLMQTADLIKHHISGLDEKVWGGTIASIVNNPAEQSPELIAGLKSLLGPEHWGQKLKMVSFYGTINPEIILPSVLLFDVLPGFRGLILIALIAASMSTFDSTVNMTTGLITRDIYQKYLRPKASTKELVGASWIFVLLLVLFSFVMAYSVRTINDIWGWIIMGLGGGLMIPGMLKFYWWRFNGGGFAVGTIVGITGAIVQRAIAPDLSEIYQFLLIGFLGFAGTVLGTYMTRPTDSKVLENFFLKTRPFGVWGKMHHLLPEKQLQAMKKEHRNDLLALPFNLLWQVTLFILPMQAIIGAWRSMVPTAALFLLGLIGMYVFWYRNLPAADAE
jgi:Na+/proline symporter